MQKQNDYSKHSEAMLAAMLFVDAVPIAVKDEVMEYLMRNKGWKNKIDY